MLLGHKDQLLWCSSAGDHTSCMPAMLMRGKTLANMPQSVVQLPPSLLTNFTATPSAKASTRDSVTLRP